MTELVPDPHLVDSFINADKDWADGCLEFIDNALAPDAGNASKISFRFEKERVLIWDNGQGVKDINALFRLGHSHSQFSREDPGFFGVGAKAEAFQDEWTDGKVNESLLFRQVFSFLISNVPDYKEPTLRAFDRNGGVD